MENNIKKRKNFLGDGVYARPPKPKTRPLIIPANKYYLDLDVLYDGILESFKDQKLRDLKEGERYGISLTVYDYYNECKFYRAHFTNQDELDKVLFEEDHNEYILKNDFMGDGSIPTPSEEEMKDKALHERITIITDGLGRELERFHKYKDDVIYYEKNEYQENGSKGCFKKYKNGKTEYSYYDFEDKTVTHYENNRLRSKMYDSNIEGSICNYYVNYEEGEIVSKGFNNKNIELFMYVDERIKPL